MPRLRLTRRVAALALAIVALVGLSAASASQLGVNGGTLQAGSTSLMDCQPVGQEIAVSFTSAFSGGAYVATAVTLKNVSAACEGLSYRLQLVATNGTPIDTNGAPAGTDLTGTVHLAAGAMTMTVATTPAATIGRVALVMYGQ